MMNEEMKSLYESLNSEEDAYALMKQNGYTGTMEDFMALCAKAADDMSMNMDDMEQIAGGSILDDMTDLAGAAVDKTVDVLSKTWDWIKENPGTTAEIVGGTLAAVAGITYVVKRRNQQPQQTLADVDDELDFVPTPKKYRTPTSWDDIDLQVNGVPMNLDIRKTI